MFDPPFSVALFSCISFWYEYRHSWLCLGVRSFTASGFFFWKFIFITRSVKAFFLSWLLIQLLCISFVFDVLSLHEGLQLTPLHHFSYSVLQVLSAFAAFSDDYVTTFSIYLKPLVLWATSPYGDQVALSCFDSSVAPLVQLGFLQVQVTSSDLFHSLL